MYPMGSAYVEYIRSNSHHVSSSAAIKIAITHRST
jgi:hypothetical protein